MATKDTGIRAHVTKTALIGLAAVLPFAAVLWVGYLIFGFLVGIVPEQFDLSIGSMHVPRYVIALGALIITVTVLYVLGTLVRAGLHHVLTAIEEAIVYRLPGVRTVYKMTKEVCAQFLGRERMPLSRPCAFRHGDTVRVGFIAEESEQSITIWVPSAPSPANGFAFSVKSGNHYEFTEADPQVVLQAIITFGAGLGSYVDEFLAWEGRR